MLILLVGIIQESAEVEGPVVYDSPYAVAQNYVQVLLPVGLFDICGELAADFVFVDGVVAVGEGIEVGGLGSSRPLEV